MCDKACVRLRNVLPTQHPVAAAAATDAVASPYRRNKVLLNKYFSKHAYARNRERAVLN